MKNIFTKTNKYFKIFIFITIFAKASDITVTVLGISFVPSNFSVSVGDNITFKISVAHTATSTTIPPNATSFNFTNTTATITPTVIGVYGFQCNPHAASGMVGSFTVVGFGSTTTGVYTTENNVEQTISHYPNPAKDILYFNFPSNILPNQYKILLLNIEGKTVIESSNKITLCKSNKGKLCQCENVNKIDISELTNDVYYIKIISNNKVEYSSKFIKE